MYKSDFKLCASNSRESIQSRSNKVFEQSVWVHIRKITNLRRESFIFFHYNWNGQCCYKNTINYLIRNVRLSRMIFFAIECARTGGGNKLRKIFWFFSGEISLRLFFPWVQSISFSLEVNCVTRFIVAGVVAIFAATCLLLWYLHYFFLLSRARALSATFLCIDDSEEWARRYKTAPIYYSLKW